MRPSTPILALLLAGCVAEPRLAASPASARLEARRALAERLRAGPAPLTVIASPTALGAAGVAALAAKGITGLGARFEVEPVPASGPHLALWFDPPPQADADAACGTGPAGAVPGPPARLLAVWCQDGAAVAMARGQAANPAGLERLVWRTTGALFPDDYASTYGFGLFRR